MKTIKHGHSSSLFLILLIVCQLCVIGQTISPQDSKSSPASTGSSVRQDPGLVSRGNDSRLSILDPGQAKRFYSQGKKYERLKMHSEAAVAFQLAVELKPDYADAYFGLGQAYYAIGRWQGALDAFERALTLEPDNKEAFTRLLALYAKVREEKKSATPNSQNKTNASKSVAIAQPSPKSSNQSETKVLPAKPPVTSAVPHEQSGGRNFHNGGVSPAAGSTNSSLPNQKLPQQDTRAGETAHATTTAKPLLPSGNQDSITPKVLPKSESNTVSGKQTNQASPSMAQQAVSPPVIVTTAGLRDGADTTKPSAPVAEKTAANAEVMNSAGTRPPNVEPTQVYRVGVGDILEIRVRDPQLDQSNLYTITATGLVEYPGLVDPLTVDGLTAEEIGQKLKSELTRLALSESPEVLVGVRDYASHTILISGQVKEPGTKVIRREAIPLYVVLADAQPLPEAERVTVIAKNNAQPSTIDLSDAAATGLLIRPGDVIMVHAAPKLYFYIGGAVKTPGEKLIRQKLSLTQAVLMAGGVTHKPLEAEIEVAREGTDGLLRSTRYRLKEINSGKLHDPLVQPGDRITVVP